MKPSPEELNRKIAEIHELYEERNKLSALYYRLGREDLVRTNAILSRLTEQDLRLVMDFAEGLASLR